MSERIVAKSCIYSMGGTYATYESAMARSAFGYVLNWR